MSRFYLTRFFNKHISSVIMAYPLHSGSIWTRLRHISRWVGSEPGTRRARSRSRPWGWMKNGLSHWSLLYLQVVICSRCRWFFMARPLPRALVQEPAGILRQRRKGSGLSPHIRTLTGPLKQQWRPLWTTSLHHTSILRRQSSSYRLLTARYGWLTAGQCTNQRNVAVGWRRRTKISSSHLCQETSLDLRNHLMSGSSECLNRAWSDRCTRTLSMRQ